MYSKKDTIVYVHDTPYKKQVILADVNIPYKFSIDRNRNTLFFCINADEFSEQSFHSVALDLDTGLASVVPGIRNGFASAVDDSIGEVYLGGADGIYKYNYDTKKAEKPALVYGIDIFDMDFKNDLYFVETANQNLFVYKNGVKSIVSELREHLMEHFVIDANLDIFFVNSTGLFSYSERSKCVTLRDDSEVNFRGATTDVHGTAHFVGRDGIYVIDHERKEPTMILPVENAYGLAFDKDNNIVFGDERSVIKLIAIDS